MISRHRHTIRLSKHDYTSPKTYFVTIGTFHHYQLLGEIKNKNIIPNKIGKIIEEILISLPKHHHCQLDTYQIMPNHLHFILEILVPIVGAQRAAPLHEWGIQPDSLPCIIRSFKSECTKQIHEQKIYFAKIFQRNYYEHIIRDKEDLVKCQKYILTNPQNWFYDKENQNNIKKTL